MFACAEVDHCHFVPISIEALLMMRVVVLNQTVASAYVFEYDVPYFVTRLTIDSSLAEYGSFASWNAAPAPDQVLAAALILGAQVAGTDVPILYFADETP